MTITIDSLQSLLPYLFILLGIVFLLGWYASKKLRSFRAVRKMNRGIDLEKKAGKFLKAKGYTVLSFQEQDSYEMIVDGKPSTINLRYDFKVKKAGKTYLVEVKTGKTATDFKNSATRRQLLEYSLVCNVDGFLLLNMDEKVIQHIEFPFGNQANYNWLWGILAGLLLVILSLLFE